MSVKYLAVIGIVATLLMIGFAGISQSYFAFAKGNDTNTTTETPTEPATKTCSDGSVTTEKCPKIDTGTSDHSSKHRSSTNIEDVKNCLSDILSSALISGVKNGMITLTHNVNTGLLTTRINQTWFDSQVASQEDCLK